MRPHDFTQAPRGAQTATNPGPKTASSSRRGPSTGVLRGLLALLLACAAPIPSHAHSIWIETVPAPGRIAAHVGFGEALQWDRRNVRKIEATQLWLKDGVGNETPVALRFHPRAECYTSEFEHSGPAALIAVCDYGVAQHGKNPAALVTFTAKRYVGSPMAWTDLDGSKRLAGLELSARYDGTNLIISLTADGHPVPDTELTLSGPKTDHQKVKTDHKGQYTWNSTPAGTYCLLASRRFEGAGEHQGKAYELKRLITTLSLKIGAGTEPTALSADPQAASLLRGALRSQSLWGERFPGFESPVVVECQGVKASGQVRVTADGVATVSLQPEHAELTRQVQHWLESMAWHRATKNVATPQSQANAVHRPLEAIAFGKTAAGETVRGVELVPIHDAFASRFWIRDGQLRGAQRQLGERTQTISVIDALQTKDGRAIPTTISTSFWDLNGLLLETEVEQRRWVEVGDVLLPAEVRSVTTLAQQPLLLMERGKFEGGPATWRMLTIRFEKPTLLAPTTTAATGN